MVSNSVLAQDPQAVFAPFGMRGGGRLGGRYAAQGGSCPQNQGYFFQVRRDAGSVLVRDVCQELFHCITHCFDY
jgi:hypothetical protein